MNTRRDLLARMRALRDLHDIFDVMRNLARMEIARLTRTQLYRRHLLDELNIVASACAPYFPPPLSRRPSSRNLYIVIGSERGMCGDFNERIASAWGALDARAPSGEVVIVGAALAERFPATKRDVTRIAGAASIDDVDAVLVNVVRRVAEHTAREAHGLVAIAADRSEVREVAMLPFEPPAAPHGTPIPYLTIEPSAFVQAFTDRYVDAVLHDLFATSLLAENQARLARMTVALDRVERDLATAKLRANRLRQEAITEEVETLLLPSVR